MSEHNYDDDESGDERRHYRRRESDNVEQITVDNFRLSLKEVIFIIGILISVATTLFKFNNTLEQAQAEHKLAYELLAAKVSQSQDNLARAEKDIDTLKTKVSNVENEMFNSRRK